MADTIRRINIYINTEAGQAQLKQLTEKQDKLVKQIAKTEQGTQAWVDKHKELAKVRDGISTLNKQLSGEMGPTIKQLTAEQNKLNRAIADMPVEARKASAEYARLMQINEAKAQLKIDERPKASFIDNFKNQAMAGAAGVVGGNLATMALEGVANYFVKGIESAAKLSDQMSDIKRTTGQTTEEVNSLNKELSKIDTRTPTSDLREMAIVAGQFGVAKDQIKGFVENLDKVNIVMGSEFGGNAETVATEMSKLRNIFTDIKSDNIGTDIGFISNAMNVLAQDGVATAPVIADLSNRIGGYGIQIGLTTGQTLGLSATLQELNVSAERGGTAVTKILQKMLTNVGDFAKIAGVPVDQFKVMLNEDLFGAFTKVMEGSKKMGSSSTLLANVIKDLEVQGAGASEVFAKLGANTDMLKAKVNTANTALTNQVSINAQAAEKQENLAGSIAQLGKEWDKLMNNSSMRSFFAFVVDAGAVAVKTIKGLGEGLHVVFDALTTINGAETVRRFRERQKAEIDELNKEVEAQNQEASRVRIAGAINGYKQLNQAELEHQVEKLRIVHQGNIAYAKELMAQGKIAEAQLHLNASMEDKAIYEGALKALNTKKKANDEGLRKKQEAAAKEAEAEAEASKKAEAEAKQRAAKKLADFKKLQEEISALEDEAARAKLSKNDAEILVIEQKYAKLLKRAAGHVAEINKLVQLEYQEKVTVLDKQIKAASEAYEKETDEFRKKELAKTAKMHEENKKQIALAYQTEQARINVLLTSARTEEETYNAQKQSMLLRAQELTDNDQLSAEQRKLIWEQYYADLKLLDDNHSQYQLQMVMSYASAAADVFGSLTQYQNAETNARVEMSTREANDKIRNEENTKTAALAQLDQKKKLGLISEQNYATAREQIESVYSSNVTKINNDLENQKRAAARKTAERERQVAIFSTIVNTAAAIIKMLADPGGFAGLGLSIAAGVSGAMQLGAIMATPLPELATGGLTNKVMGQSGQTYNATKIGTFAGGGTFQNASYGIIGEKGTELVIPNWLYSNPQMVNTMKFLEYAIANGSVPMQQFANGGTTTRSLSEAETPGTRSLSGAEVNSTELIAAINLNTQVNLQLLTKLNEGIYAKFVYDEYQTQMKFIDNSLNSNN